MAKVKEGAKRYDKHLFYMHTFIHSYHACESQAHDEHQTCVVGDIVRIQATRWEDKGVMEHTFRYVMCEGHTGVN